MIFSPINSVLFYNGTDKNDSDKFQVKYTMWICGRNIDFLTKVYDNAIEPFYEMIEYIEIRREFILPRDLLGDKRGIFNEVA